MNRLIIAHLSAEHYDSARALCNEGARRFPNDRVMRTCVLNVLGYAGSGKADLAQGWAALGLEEREGVFEHVNGIWPPGRFFIAAMLARTGLVDSARTVIMATRATERAAGAPTAGAVQEAYAWTLLSAPDSAMALLESYVRAQPAERSVIAQLPWFHALRSNSRFERLINSP